MDESFPLRNKRIENLDVLRGFFVSLALLQHFAYYWNTWFINFFKDAGKGVFTFYDALVGQHIQLQDPISYHLLLFFTPWVSQIYLSLAAFNLSSRDSHEFKTVYLKKLKLFLFLFILFIIENFFVAPSFGEAISFYPLLAWMVILSVLTFIYAKFGIKGVGILFILSFIPWFNSGIFIAGDRFERYFQYHIHPFFEYDARLEYFLPSGCLGLLLGYLHYHKKKWAEARYFFTMAIGVAAIGIYILFGDSFHLNTFDILATEHELSESLLGTIGILGMNTTVILFFTFIDEKGIKLNNWLGLFKWIGVNSLLIFALHRILFVHLIAPMRLFVGAIFHWNISPGLIHEAINASFVCLIVFVIKKLKIGNIINKS